MKARSIRGASVNEIQTALEQAMTNGFEPTLAIVFMSIKQDREAVCEILRKEGVDILGATSAGEFIDSHQSEGESAILLMDINRDHYSILFCDTHDKEMTDAANEIAGKVLSTFSNPAFILCSTCLTTEVKMFNGSGLMQSLGNALGAGKMIFGGMAGDDATFTGTWIFTGEQQTDEGFALLVLDNDMIDVYGSAVSGWKPLGKVRTVTKSEDGWLYSLDDQPALEMYLRYLGHSRELWESGHREFMEAVGLYHPFLAIDSGDPVLRTPMLIDREKNAIKLDFPLPEGAHLQFTLPPDFDIVETVLNNANELKKEKNADADALLVFSCFGRLTALGPMVKEENEGLHKIWNAPMAGFFSYGEYGKDQSGQHEFHSTTCSWVAIKEK